MKKQIYILISAVILLGLLYFLNQAGIGGLFSSSKEDVIVPIVTISDIEYFSGVQGYFVKPEKEGKYPGVVLVPDALNSEPEIHFLANEIAKRGYKVVAVNLLKNPVQNATEAQKLEKSFNSEEGLANIRGAINLLKQDGIKNLGTIGWGFGATQSMALALSGEQLSGTVIYYNDLASIATSTYKFVNIHGPIFAVFAQNDKNVSMQSVKEFGDALTKAKVKNEIYVYPEVSRGFASPSSSTYSPKETSQAWAKVLVFLRNNLK